VFESTRDANSEIYIMDPEGGQQTRLTNNLSQESVPTLSPQGDVGFASSASGNWDLFTVSELGRSGPGRQPRQITESDASDFAPTWSPDGEVIAYEHRTGAGTSTVFVTDRFGEVQRPLVNLSGENFAPTWSPESGRVAFVHRQGKTYHVVTVRRDGSGLVDLSARTGNNADFDPAWSPRGDEIAVSRRNAKGNYDIWALGVGRATERRLTSASGEESSPTWSPDGREIAYVRGHAGAYDIFVMNADGSGQRNITNSPGGADIAPEWGPPGSSAALLRAARRVSARAPTSGARATAGFFCTKTGTNKADTLNGGGGVDVICGLGGADVIRGAGGNDILSGGAGNDRIFGQKGSDLLFARAANGNEKDKVRGGNGQADMGWVDRGKDDVGNDVETKRPP